MKLIWAVPPQEDDADAIYVLFALQVAALVLCALIATFAALNYAGDLNDPPPPAEQAIAND